MGIREEKLGLWPFAPQRVYDEISANGFADVVRETYTTAGKEHPSYQP
jgi:hypothetical protein